MSLEDRITELEFKIVVLENIVGTSEYKHTRSKKVDPEIKRIKEYIGMKEPKPEYQHIW